MNQGGYCSVVFYVRIGGALMAPFFCGWCIRDLVLCDCVTGGEWKVNLPSCIDNTFY